MLDTERAYLETHRAELMQQYGTRFLVIKGEEVTGSFESIEEALQGAASKHGLESVLIRRASDPSLEVSAPAYTLGILNADPAHTVPTTIHSELTTA